MSLLASHPIDVLKGILAQLSDIARSCDAPPSHSTAESAKNLLTTAMFHYRFLSERGLLPAGATDYQLCVWEHPVSPNTPSTRTLSGEDYDFDKRMLTQKEPSRTLANQFIHIAYFGVILDRTTDDLHVLVTSEQERRRLFEAPLSQIVGLLAAATTCCPPKGPEVEVFERASVF